MDLLLQKVTDLWVAICQRIDRFPPPIVTSNCKNCPIYEKKRQKTNHSLKFPCTILPAVISIYFVAFNTVHRLSQKQKRKNGEVGISNTKPLDKNNTNIKYYFKLYRLHQMKSMVEPNIYAVLSLVLFCAGSVSIKNSIRRLICGTFAS